MTRVLITGCSTGIGRSLCEELTERGLEVIATAPDPAALEPLPVAMRLALDVTSEASVEAAVAQAGRIDVLVNNAGIGVYSPVEMLPLPAVQRLFEINVFGMLRLVRAVAPQMRERRSGLIVQHSSVAGRVARAMQGHYAASKHALEALSEAMRVELAPFGVRVALVQFGGVKTELSRKAEAGTPKVDSDYEPLVATYYRPAAGPPTQSSAQDAARAVADVIADGGRKLRYQATPKAFEVIAARQALDDDAWEASELRRLGLALPARETP